MRSAIITYGKYGLSLQLHYQSSGFLSLPLSHSFLPPLTSPSILFSFFPFFSTVSLPSNVPLMLVTLFLAMPYCFLLWTHLHHPALSHFDVFWYPISIIQFPALHIPPLLPLCHPSHKSSHLPSMGYSACYHPYSSERAVILVETFFRTCGDNPVTRPPMARTTITPPVQVVNWLLKTRPCCILSHTAWLKSLRRVDRMSCLLVTVVVRMSRGYPLHTLTPIVLTATFVRVTAKLSAHPPCCHVVMAW